MVLSWVLLCWPGVTPSEVRDCPWRIFLTAEDFVSNTLIAYKGFPEMAIGACYSSPISSILSNKQWTAFTESFLNTNSYLLLGLGVSFLFRTIKVGAIDLKIRDANPDLSNMHYVGFFFLLAGLLFSLIIVPLNAYGNAKTKINSGFRFQYPRWGSVALICNYVIFLIFSALLLFKIIAGDIYMWDL